MKCLLNGIVGNSRAVLLLLLLSGISVSWATLSTISVSMTVTLLRGGDADSVGNLDRRLQMLLVICLVWSPWYLCHERVPCTLWTSEPLALEVGGGGESEVLRWLSVWDCDSDSLFTVSADHQCCDLIFDRARHNQEGTHRWGDVFLKRLPCKQERDCEFDP